MDSVKNLRELEQKALRCDMATEVKSYFSVAAGNNNIQCINEKAFESFLIRPQVLRNVSSVDPSVSLLGQKVSCPIGISPTGFHQMAHPDAENATAAASFKEDCLAIISCVASRPLAEIAQKSSHGPKWLQIYILKDRSRTLGLVKMAENHGYSALVVTVDSPVGGLWRLSMPRTFFSKFSHKAANLPRPINELLDASLEFEDLKWLRSVTRLPIVVKGIMSGQDAVEAVNYGASAILVSNHGGRQINGVIPTMYVLEEVVNAVKDVNPQVEVYIDGGVRTGSDVFRACALGARAVFIGKPVIWGLALGGEAGVRKVLQILKTEFLLTMQLAGVKNVGEITRDMVSKYHCSWCKL